MPSALEQKRNEIVTHLTRLVLRRRMLQRHIAMETFVAIAGASVCIASGNRSGWAFATAGLASLSAFLAARDHRRARVLGGQIASLARVMSAFV